MFFVFFVLYAFFYWLCERYDVTYYIGRIFGALFKDTNDYAYWGQYFAENFDLVIPFFLSAIITYLVFQKDPVHGE